MYYLGVHNCDKVRTLRKVRTCLNKYAKSGQKKHLSWCNEVCCIMSSVLHKTYMFSSDTLDEKSFEIYKISSKMKKNKHVLSDNAVTTRDIQSI